MLGSASLLKPQQAQTAQPQQQSSDGSSFGLDAKLQALAQLFEMASTQTQVDQPLCLDCAAQLKDEVEAQVCLAGEWCMTAVACDPPDCSVLNQAGSAPL